jgi:hypothetical protein
MVSGVRLFSLINCAGHTEPETLLQEQAVEISVCSDSQRLPSLILPFTPIGLIFGFSPLPTSFLLLVAIIVAGYIISAEMAKMIFYKKVR